MRAENIRAGRIEERGGKVGEREGRKWRNGSGVDPTNFGRKSTPTAERQSAQMSKIINDGLTRSGTGCFIAVPIWQQWASKG